jgi:hypothetical protein
LREEMVFVYIAWIIFCLIQILAGWRKPEAFTNFFEIIVLKPSSEVSPERRK